MGVLERGSVTRSKDVGRNSLGRLPFPGRRRIWVLPDSELGRSLVDRPTTLQDPHRRTKPVCQSPAESPVQIRSNPPTCPGHGDERSPSWQNRICRRGSRHQHDRSIPPIPRRHLSSPIQPRWQLPRRHAEPRGAKHLPAKPVRQSARWGSAWRGDAPASPSQRYSKRMADHAPGDRAAASCQPGFSRLLSGVSAGS